MFARWLGLRTRPRRCCAFGQTRRYKISWKSKKEIKSYLTGSLLSFGVSCTWQQCKVKIKNLVQKYRKIKDVYGVSGRGRVPFVFYDDIDAVLGTRAATEPPVLLQSGAAETEVTVGIEESLAAEVAENPFQST